MSLAISSSHCSRPRRILSSVALCASSSSRTVICSRRRASSSSRMADLTALSASMRDLRLLSSRSTLGFSRRRVVNFFNCSALGVSSELIFPSPSVSNSSSSAFLSSAFSFEAAVSSSSESFGASPSFLTGGVAGFTSPVAGGFGNGVGAGLGASGSASSAAGLGGGGSLGLAGESRVGTAPGFGNPG